jgi:hypothetical protein
VRGISHHQEWNVVLIHQNARIAAADLDRVGCPLRHHAKKQPKKCEAKLIHSGTYFGLVYPTTRHDLSNFVKAMQTNGKVWISASIHDSNLPKANFDGDQKMILAVLTSPEVFAANRAAPVPIPQYGRNVRPPLSRYGPGPAGFRNNFTNVFRQVADCAAAAQTRRAGRVRLQRTCPQAQQE